MNDCYFTILKAPNVVIFLDNWNLFLFQNYFNSAPIVSINSTTLEVPSMFLEAVLSSTKYHEKLKYQVCNMCYMCYMCNMCNMCYMCNMRHTVAIPTAVPLSPISVIPKLTTYIVTPL